jgi:hypothetical protein
MNGSLYALKCTSNTRNNASTVTITSMRLDITNSKRPDCKSIALHCLYLPSVPQVSESNTFVFH